MDDTDPICSVHDLMRPYDDVLVDRAEVAEVGPGWRAITEHLLVSLAREVRLTPGARLGITTVCDRLGALRIVSEAASNLPSGDLDLHEVRRIEREAEGASLRTCSCCGLPGVLRHVDGGFATRCERHVDRGVAHGIPETAHTPLEVTMNLTRSHEDWLSTGEDTSIIVPRGWLPLAVEALATSKAISGGATGFRLLGMRALCGRLDIRIAHEAEPLDLSVFTAWRSVLLAAGDAAFFTCEICGAPGRIRPTERGEGAPPPRCDAHADLRKLPSRQATIRTDDVDPAFVISSSRPQWTVSAARVAARQPVNAPVSVPKQSDAFALYEVRDVMAALGLANEDGDADPFDVKPSPPDNEHQTRLRRLVQLGEAGRWRQLARPTTDMVGRLDALARRAPHLEPLSSLVRRHLLAAISIGLPVTLPPTLVLGPPGVGKTWFMTELADVLGMPFRSHAMSAASHSDGIGGAHPVWRNAQIGLVAKVLFGEKFANPILFVDEFDKVPPGHGVDDLFRPYFVLLEPKGAQRFTDAFLGFPIDASAVTWVMAANGLGTIPDPIVSRLTVVEVHSPERSHLAAVARSVWAECNARRLGHFPAEPPADLVEALVEMTPRAMRMALEDGMTAAAAEGRRYVRASDVARTTAPIRHRIGFV